jgi:hypothetical protein
MSISADFSSRYFVNVWIMILGRFKLHNPAAVIAGLEQMLDEYAVQ